MPRKAKPLAERLDAFSEPYVEGHCQLWLGDTRKGYGRLTVKGRAVPVHRAAWEVEHGPVPPGAQVMHTCDTPLCRSRDHLVLGDHAANMADRNGKGRQGRPRGEINARAKLTETQARTIFMLPSSMTSAEVGATYGVSAAAIRMLRTRKSWRHLEV
jgi:hypothetical protein